MSYDKNGKFPERVFVVSEHYNKCLTDLGNSELNRLVPKFTKASNFRYFIHLKLFDVVNL